MRVGRRVPVLGAFAFAAILVFTHLGDLPLLNPDEGRNAEVAREMALSGSWLVPTYDGLPYLDKPAFYFKAVALSLQLFGRNEWAARLPSALFALALLALVFVFTRREYGERTAALAVATVAATPLFVAFARIVIFDMPLAFFVTAAILAGYRAEGVEGRSRSRWYLVGAAAAGLATLVKGPVGFIVPALVLLAFGAVERKGGVWKRLLHPRNLGVFLLVVLPWFVGVSLQRPDFPYYGLVQESLVRFTTPEFQRTAPFWYYVPVLLAVCFAWSLLLPEAVVGGVRRRARWTRADRLLATWSVVVVLFFSLSQSKLPGYVLTAAVALGILVARLFVRALEAPASWSGRAVRRGALAIAVVSTLLTLWLAAETARPGLLPSLFRLAEGRDYLRARSSFPALLPTLGVTAALSLTGILARRVRLMVASFLAVPLLLLTLSFGGLEEYGRSASARELSRAAAALLPDPDVPIACLECFPTGLPFYLERTVSVITADGRETTSNYIPFHLARLEEWPPQMVPLEERDAWIDGRRGPLFLLARPDRRSVLDSLAAARGGFLFDLPARWSGLLLPPPGG